MGLELIVLENPVAQRLLGVLRDKNTPPHVFREAMETIGLLMGYEIAKRLPKAERIVETPLGEAKALEPRDDEVVVVGVLRASLPMVWGMLRILWRARAGFIAARRLEESLSPRIEVSYSSLPGPRGGIGVLVDPMLATASTLIEATRLVLERLSPRSLVYATLIASKPGLERLSNALEEMKAPATTLYTVAVDPVLNDRGFIVPGLGDAGDRAFNTG